MPIEMTIKTKGIAEAIQTLENARNILGNQSYQQFLSRICVPELKKDFALCFQGGHRDWPPLKPETIARKLQEGFPETPLVRTGLYQRTATALRRLRISGRRLTIVCPLEYPIYLEDRFPVYSEVARKWRGGEGGKLRRLYNKYQQQGLR